MSSKVPGNSRAKHLHFRTATPRQYLRLRRRHHLLLALLPAHALIPELVRRIVLSRHHGVGSCRKKETDVATEWSVPSSRRNRHVRAVTLEDGCQLLYVLGQLASLYHQVKASVKSKAGFGTRFPIPANLIHHHPVILSRQFVKMVYGVFCGATVCRTTHP